MAPDAADLRRHRKTRRLARTALRSGDELPGRAKEPGGHYQNGGLYEVNIRLALPNGREVNVGRTATADELHSDLTFAINDAFKRARAARSRSQAPGCGEAAQRPADRNGHAARSSGEFGFLESGDGREIYFHRNSVLDGGLSRLAVGSRATFAEEAGEKGPQASTVKLLGKHGLRA